MSIQAEGSPEHSRSGFNVAAQAERAAQAIGRRAGVAVREVDDIDGLRAVSALLESVWGRTAEGAPVHSEVLRSLAHAGGCTTAAFDATGALVGAAALAVAAPAGATYSLIAAVSPGANDRGIGHAVKLHQRAWALARGYDTMVWTFDPLVSRNARFNLVKLGAQVDEYVAGFYGQMSDEINGTDDGDRLVATWRLGSHRAIAASEATATEPVGPEGQAPSLRLGPDGEPMVRRDGAGLWVRVPADIVGLRHRDPRQAIQWRLATRDVFVAAFAEGLSAIHMTRHGWYLLTAKGEK